MGLVEELQGDESGGAAETDNVGQAVKLSAEIGGVAGEAGEAAVDGIEEHGDEDQVRRRQKSVAVEPLRPVIGASLVEGGDVHGAEAADGVAERGQAGKGVDRADISSAAMASNPPPARFARVGVPFAPTKASKIVQARAPLDGIVIGRGLRVWIRIVHGSLVFVSGSLSLVLGERVGVRGHSASCATLGLPPHPTLSPAYRGEGRPSGFMPAIAGAPFSPLRNRPSVLRWCGSACRGAPRCRPRRGPFARPAR